MEVEVIRATANELLVRVPNTVVQFRLWLRTESQNFEGSVGGRLFEYRDAAATPTPARRKSG